MLQDHVIEKTSPGRDEVRQQLETLLAHKAFHSSRRSSDFLRYVVEQTLEGAADNIKERTIGIEVFGRQPSYETASDHVVRTAAIDVRKRLAMYYSDLAHAGELRMVMVPGSYVPHFFHPQSEALIAAPTAAEADDTSPGPPAIGKPPRSRRRPILAFLGGVGATVLLGAIAAGVAMWRQWHSPEYLFWKPLLTASGPVLLATGDIPSGPPTAEGTGVPVIQRGSATTLPLADTITIALVLDALQSRGQRVEIRPEISSSFSDLKQSPSVLIGAFNNEWSLRLTHALRFSLALDPEHHLIYIRDADHPESRAWSQITGSSIAEQQTLRGGPAQHDFALITRIRNPETGQVTVILGGLYAYGTQAAGEFINDPKSMRQLASLPGLGDPDTGIQIVLETSVTDETPGVARVLALQRF